MDTGYNFNWQDTHILGSANSQRAREVIEALHSGEPSVNHAIKSILQVNAFAALINMPHPPLFSLLFLPHDPPPPFISTGL